MCLYMYMHASTHVSMYECLCTCMCVCAFACMCVMASDSVWHTESITSLPAIIIRKIILFQWNWSLGNYTFTSPFWAHRFVNLPFRVLNYWRVFHYHMAGKQRLLSLARVTHKVSSSCYFVEHPSCYFPVCSERSICGSFNFLVSQQNLSSAWLEE